MESQDGSYSSGSIESFILANDVNTVTNLTIIWDLQAADMDGPGI